MDKARAAWGTWAGGEVGLGAGVVTWASEVRQRESYCVIHMNKNFRITQEPMK